MFKFIFGSIGALFVLTALGWIPWFLGIVDFVHKSLYGVALAHPHGDTAQHVNDWLTFLPEGALVRSLIIGGLITGMMGVYFLSGILGMRQRRVKRDRNAREEARIHTLNSYHGRQS